MTNTNWQNYGGETTMSYFSQIGVLTVQQFVSAAVGIAVAIALVRGFSRRNSPTIGNFWVDITRCMLYILLPDRVPRRHHRRRRRARCRPWPGRCTIHDSLNGVTQTIPRGPAGFMGPIMQLGTNGGGFFNVDLAHPFENPTALTNLLYIWLTLSIPFALTYTFGKMVGSIRHGVALLAAMVLIFGVWVGFTSYSEHTNNPAVVAAGVHSTVGNTEGKEVRFGDTTTALFNMSMTQTSDGAVDGQTDSFNPMGGFGPLTGMMLGEVTPGGTGSGLYTILIYAIIAVFIGGLMIGRTPEYLGKKIQAKEVKLAGLGALVMPIIVLVLTAIAVSIHAGRAGPLNAGPHGFTEILYGLTSQGNNNGSAMAGLTGNTAFYNVIGAIDMLHRPVRHHDPGPGPGGLAGGQERRPGVARHLPDRQRHVRRPGHRRDRDHRWPHLLPRRLARPDRRAAQPRKVLLMTTLTTQPQPQPQPGPAGAARRRPRRGASSTARSCGRALDRRVQEARPPGADQEPGHVRGAGRARWSPSSRPSPIPASSTGPSPSGSS